MAIVVAQKWPCVPINELDCGNALVFEASPCTPPPSVRLEGYSILRIVTSWSMCRHMSPKDATSRLLLWSSFMLAGGK